jgi:hypothetical protein
MTSSKKFTQVSFVAASPDKTFKLSDLLSLQQLEKRSLVGELSAKWKVTAWGTITRARARRWAHQQTTTDLEAFIIDVTALRLQIDWIDRTRLPLFVDAAKRTLKGKQKCSTISRTKNGSRSG